jgi:hypothetical protein
MQQPRVVALVDRRRTMKTSISTTVVLLLQTRWPVTTSESWGLGSIVTQVHARETRATTTFVAIREGDSALLNLPPPAPCVNEVQDRSPAPIPK